MEEQPQTKAAGPVEWLSNTQTVIEALTAIIGVVSAVVGFIAANGGPVAILMEIGVFAFAAYVGAFPAAFALVGLDSLGGVMKRQTNDQFFIGAAVTLMIGFALLIRFVVFDPNYTEDLDVIGETFLALTGVAALLLPVGLVWYFKGSKSAGS